MKPLGPYVAARDLPGRMNSPVRTLRATDRLTGMPVLLHALPAPQALPALPDHPSVLSPAECVKIAGEAFMVTELPLQARPAQDPEQTAQGALTALAALHGAGVVHGGLSASQLWSVDGEVRLAGAGLPWGGEARPADDLYALAVILHEMGGVPRALRPLLDTPGRLDARTALAQLSAGHSVPAASEPARPDDRPTAQPDASPSRPAAPAEIELARTAIAPNPTPLPSPAGSPLVAVTETGLLQSPSGESGERVRPDGRGRRGRGSRFRLPGLTAPRDTVTPDAPPARSAAAPGLPVPADPVPAAPVADIPAPPASPEPVAARVEVEAETPAADSTPVSPAAAAPLDAPAHDGTPIVLGDVEEALPVSTFAEQEPAVQVRTAGDLEDTPVRPVAAEPDTASPSASAGRLSPQERRRREHEARREQTARDAQAAAARRQRAPAPAAVQTPPPLQIGFEDDLPAWEADGPAQAPRPALNLREVERLPASLRRAPAEPDTPVEAEPVGAIPARRRVGEPIRIGWDEDDSWRVVREAPVVPLGSRRPLPWRVLFWVVLAVVLAALVVGLVKVVQGRAAQAPPVPARSVSAAGRASKDAGPVTVAAPQPQTVPFTVRGVAGATARLSVEQSPKEANLTPGASLGTAPGRVTFPAPGTYRLRVVVDGFAPGSMTVTVPRTQPVTIDLDR